MAERGGCNLHMLIKLLFGSLALHVGAPSAHSVCRRHLFLLCLFPHIPHVTFRGGICLFDSYVVLKRKGILPLQPSPRSFRLSSSRNQTSSPLCTSSSFCLSLLSHFLIFPANPHDPLNFLFYPQLPFCDLHPGLLPFQLYNPPTFSPSIMMPDLHHHQLSPSPHIPLTYLFFFLFLRRKNLLIIKSSLLFLPARFMSPPCKRRSVYLLVLFSTIIPTLPFYNTPGNLSFILHFCIQPWRFLSIIL